MWHAMESIEALAEDLNITIESVRSRARDLLGEDYNLMAPWAPRLTEMWHSRARLIDIADELGVAMTTLLRRAESLKLGERQMPPNEAEEALWARAAQLIEEGVPSTWVAEDTGLNVYAIRKRLKPGDTSGWNEAWPGIRFNRELKALHDEFAPRRLRPA